MDATVIASLVGFGAAVVTALVASALTRRRLREELQSTFRGELARKQVAACEALWSALESTSFSLGSARVIQGEADAHTVELGTARELMQKVTTVFYSSHGLFLSRRVRTALFDLRDFTKDELLTQTSESQRVPISKNKAERFRSKATALRIALRAEIGVEDLGAAREIAKDG
jgi:hypothetical protein